MVFLLLKSLKTEVKKEEQNFKKKFIMPSVKNFVTVKQVFYIK